MDTIVRPPDSISPSVATTRRRRWPRIVLGVFLVVFAIGVAVGSIWIANYDPFVRGTRGWHPGDDRIRVTEVDALGASGRLFEFESSAPARFRYTFSITNAGPIGVTIEGVGTPPGNPGEPDGEITRRPLRLVEDETLLDDGELIFERWHPFVLRPGQQASIEMEVRFDPIICLPRGTSLVWWPETIRFSVFGMSRVATFESDLEVRVVGTQEC